MFISDTNSQTHLKFLFYFSVKPSDFGLLTDSDNNFNFGICLTYQINWLAVYVEFCV